MLQPAADLYTTAAPDLDAIYCCDALALLGGMAAGSVDALITDPPYNLTNLSWETAIDWHAFWHEARRVLRTKNSPAILFSQQPFTTDLITSNRKGWRDEIVWHKTRQVGFLNANRRPLECHELLEVFADGEPDYFPQFEESTVRGSRTQRAKFSDIYGAQRTTVYIDTGRRYPRSVWTFSQRDNLVDGKVLHPTAKPLSLMTRLVLTYTRPGWVVCDPFAGSGSTLVAAQRAGRHYIGCDVSPEYVEIARKRLAQPFTLPMLFEATATLPVPETDADLGPLFAAR